MLSGVFWSVREQEKVGERMKEAGFLNFTHRLTIVISEVQSSTIPS